MFGVVECDEHGRILWANARARELLGDRLVGRSVDAFGGPRHAQLRREFDGLARIMAGRLLDVMGQPMYVGLIQLSEGRVAAILTPAANGGVASALQDLEAALAELGNEVDLVERLGRFPLPFIVGNGEQWRFASTAFSDLLGWSREDLEAMRWEDLVHPDDIESTGAEVQRVLEQGGLGEAVNRYRHKLGGYVECRWKWKRPDETGMTWAVVIDWGQRHD